MLCGHSNVGALVLVLGLGDLLIHMVLVCMQAQSVDPYVKLIMAYKIHSIPL